MFSHRAATLSLVFAESSAGMSVCLTNIAGLAAWTCDFIDNAEPITIGIFYHRAGLVSIDASILMGLPLEIKSFCHYTMAMTQHILLFS